MPPRLAGSTSQPVHSAASENRVFLALDSVLGGPEQLLRLRSSLGFGELLGLVREGLGKRAACCCWRRGQKV